MAETTTPAPRAYILGSELREARDRAGLGLRKLASQLDVSHSVIVRWERGERVPSTESVSAVCAVLGVTGTQRDRLLDLAREAADEPANSVSVGDVGERDQLAALLEFERTATTITNVAPLLMPGLVQTGDYARAVLGGSSDTDRMVSLRVGRRDVITRRRNPVRYRAFILESVLHHPVTDDDAHREQLDLLVELAQRDNVEVRVIPPSVFTAAHSGPFVLVEFERAAPVVHLEHHRSSVFLRDKGDVEAFLAARDDIDRVAMSPDQSTKLIASLTNREE